MSRGSSLSRSNSQSSIGMDLLSNPTGPSAIPRRWVPSHRVANSVDAIRGKWEERVKEDETRDSSTSPTKEGSRARTPTAPSPGIAAIDRSSTPPLQLTANKDEHRTPTYLKRRTLPAPIIASPLSPNSTGTTVEDDTRSLSAVTNRIHLPSLTRTPSSSAKKYSGDPTASDSTPSGSLAFSRKQRSNTLDNASAREFPRYTSANDVGSNNTRTQNESKNSSDASVGKEHVSFIRKRPASLYGAHHANIHSESNHRLASGSDNVTTPSSQTASAINPMFPTSYRSSYMSTKKAGTYGENLVKGRKLGRHLPRIASGDGDDSKSVNSDATNGATMTSGRQSQKGTGSLPTSPHKQDIPTPPADDVAGLPGRVQLKAPSAPAVPSPSYKLYGALWADTQRHLIQAYEYLCHVGEAQQWVEGCLGEELEFGVVEMEDGLRNGVVLAKLVRAFKGDAAVRKIYDVSDVRFSLSPFDILRQAPKLDFRHSDNINYFFNFVREVGLPEVSIFNQISSILILAYKGFIFELTDLYEKKNLPKVIYCIHALRCRINRLQTCLAEI